jgi:hypothetical protein
MMDLATIETRITEVEAAIHNLMTGAREVEVVFNDRRVRYSEAQLPELERYHAWLLQQKETLTNGGRRPIYISQ